MNNAIDLNNDSVIPLQIGITGGIGSGKTTVCKIFEALGIPVYYADDRAKALMVENEQVRTQVRKHIGGESYFNDGQLNRGYIAQVVFKDKEKLNVLNRIVHPAVLEDGLKWHNSQHGVPYTLKEAALMIESGNYKFLDKLIVVRAPEELRVKRVMKRDEVKAEAVYARMRNQMPEDQKLRYADYIIINDGNHSLIKQIWAIHQNLSEFAKTKNPQNNYSDFDKK